MKYGQLKNEYDKNVNINSAASGASWYFSKCVQWKSNHIDKIAYLYDIWLTRISIQYQRVLLIDMHTICKRQEAWKSLSYWKNRLFIKLWNTYDHKLLEAILFEW